MDSENQAVLEKLLINDAKEAPKEEPAPQITTQVVLPEPVYCLKGQTQKGEKIFINICKSDQLPAPKDISAVELAEIISSEDPMRYRVPISFGLPHTELDKSGKSCTAYDVIVNPKFLKKTEEDDVFHSFFMTVILDGLEQKYELTLDRTLRKLKRKKCLGFVSEQTVRTSYKPVIMEMDSENHASPHQTNAIPLAGNSGPPSAPEPKYVIFREPASGKPTFMVLEVQLPGVKSSKYIQLDVGEDRVVLDTLEPSQFHLDIDLAYYVKNGKVGAQFNRKTKKLVVTMPTQ
ncbi:PIH1 domain-containing protein 1-like [Oscarella lobularis]|uniref:PIH1 domain-containing protein 1-like n=1 Tax=Oscarella lobularis TaxID=121494 RepID=UPI0033144526